MLGFDEILVPVDGSDSANRAAQFAAALAQATQARLRLMHVLADSAYAAIGLARMDVDEIERAQKSAAREVFVRARSAIELAIGPDVEVAETVRMGDPAQQIIDQAEANPRTLIVMGRRGLSPMKSLLVGSVSEKLVRHVSTAVTLVK